MDVSTKSLVGGLLCAWVVLEAGDQADVNLTNGLAEFFAAERFSHCNYRWKYGHRLEQFKVVSPVGLLGRCPVCTSIC